MFQQVSGRKIVSDKYSSSSSKHKELSLFPYIPQYKPTLYSILPSLLDPQLLLSRIPISSLIYQT